MWETLASPTVCSFPAGSVQVLSSSGDSTDQDQVLPGGSVRPGPVQNVGPQRTVQLKKTGGPRAPSIVKILRPRPIAISSSSSTEIPLTLRSRQSGSGTPAHAPECGL